MQNFITTIHNKLPLGNFTSTVSSCGGQTKSIDILIRGLSWANKLSPTQACDRAVEDYFDSPGIHFNFLCKFWHPDGNGSSKKPTDNIFHEWIRFICTTYDSNGRQVPKIQYLRLTYERRLNEGDNTPFLREIADRPIDKEVVTIRKKFKDDLVKYKKYLVSWPKNKINTTFNWFINFVRTYLFIVPNSEEEREFSNVFRMLESSLGTLCAFDMGGLGLPPMFQWFGLTGPISALPDVSAISGTNADAVQRLRDDMMDARDGYNDSKMEIKALELEFQRQCRVGNLVDGTSDYQKAFRSYKQYVEVKKKATDGELWSEKVERTRKAYWTGVSNIEYGLWPSNVSVPISDEGFLDRWYAFAAQYWLNDEHSKWFSDIAIMSHSDTLSEVFQNTVCVIVDDASPSSSKFLKCGLNVLLMPTLISNEKSFVHVCRNISPWWRPPEIQTEGEERISEAKVIVENIIHETDRTSVIKNKLDTVKKLSVNLSEKENVVFYTSFPEVIGYCLFQNIEVNVYNKWTSKTVINTKSLRGQVLRQSSLLGSSVTRLVKDNTKILTYMVLMALSCSSGLPFYSAFGWSNVLSKWYSLVKEYFTLNKADLSSMESADRSCAWLAREGVDGILINKRLLVPLISKILHGRFVGKDRPEIKYGIDFNVYSKNYLKWVEENRVGTGIVTPVPVLSSWMYQTGHLFKSLDVLNEFDKEEAYRKYEEREKEKEKRIFESDMELWEREKRAYDEDQIETWNNEKDEYIARYDRIFNAVDGTWTIEKREFDKDMEEFQKLIVDERAKITEAEEVIESSNTKIVTDSESREELMTEKKSIEDRLKEERAQAEAQSGVSSYLSSAVSSTLNMLPGYTTDEQSVRSLDLMIKELDKHIEGWQKTIAFYELEKIEAKKNENKWLKQQDDLSSREPYEPYLEWKNENEWVSAHPKPTDGDETNPPSFSYKKYPIPRPVQGKHDEEVSEIVKLSTILGETTLDGIGELNAKEYEDRTWELDSDDEEENKMEEIKKEINTKIAANAASDTTPWYERVEWMYAQRQYFQDNYYAPRGELEDFVRRFGIRFKDWTGVSNISINT